MFDELNEAFTHLVDCVSRVDVETIDGKGAARLVGIADGIRRCGDSLRTVAVGQVERTNGWKGEGAKSISEWLATETDCALRSSVSSGARQPTPASTITSDITVALFGALVFITPASANK